MKKLKYLLLMLILAAFTGGLNAACNMPVVTSTSLSCGATNDGTISISQSPPCWWLYDYGIGQGWTNQTTQTGLTAGTYNVDIWNQTEGYVSQVVVVIGPNQTPSIGFIVVTDNVCDDDANGTISFNTYTSGTGISGYVWSHGDLGLGAPGPISGLTSGMYTVTITEISGCTFTKSFTINSTDPLTYSTSSSGATCISLCDAKASVSASSPSGVSYLWSNSATTSSINNLCPGTYTVTMTNGSGCTKVHNFTLATDPITSPHWQKTTNNLVQGKDNIKRIIRGEDNDIYVMGEFTDVTEIEGMVVQSSNSSPYGQNGIYVAKYNGCGQLIWISYSYLHTSTYPGFSPIPLVGFDLDFDKQTKEVVLFAKWVNPGTMGINWGFVSGTGNFVSLFNSNGSDVYSIDLDAGNGDFIFSDFFEYDMTTVTYSDICTSGKSRNNLKYIGGQMGGIAKIIEYNTATNAISNAASDANNNNIIVDFEIENNIIYAGVNLFGSAQFDLGLPPIGTNNGAMVFSKVIGSNSANQKVTSANDVKIKDIHYDNTSNMVTAVGQYDGTMTGWTPVYTAQISSPAHTGFITRFEATNLNTYTSYQLKDASMISSSANAIYEDNYSLMVAGTVSGTSATIVTISGGSSFSATTSFLSGGGLNSMWNAKFSGSGIAYIDWMTGSSSTGNMAVNDIIYNKNREEFFTVGSYFQDVNLQPSSMLLHPFGGGVVQGFAIRGGEFYNPGTGEYYKTEGNNTGISNNSAPDETLYSNELKLYPNPNNGNFKVAVSNLYTGTITLTITDITGHVVYQNTVSKETNNLEVTINSNQLIPGMYMLNVNSNQKISHQKFIVK